MRSGIVSLIVAAWLFPFAFGCGSPSAPSPGELREILESTSYTFHYATGDAVDSRRQEAFHEWAIRELSVTVPRKIDYYKYRDRSHIRALTGRNTNGFAEPDRFEVHAIWPWEPHEAAHVLTAIIGWPSDFFNEGIAVAFSVSPADGVFESLWQSQSVHAWARRFRTEGRLVPLAQMVETESFRALDEAFGYPVAGSFVRFLIDRYGIGRFRAFFEGGSRMETRAAIQERFVRVYGIDLNEAEQEWLTFLSQP